MFQKLTMIRFELRPGKLCQNEEFAAGSNARLNRNDSTIISFFKYSFLFRGHGVMRQLIPKLPVLHSNAARPSKSSPRY